MIANVTLGALDWIGSACPGWAVEAGPPAIFEGEQQAVRLTLLELMPAAHRVERALARSHLTARYMVTVAAADALTAQDGLGLVTAAAIARDQTEVRLENTPHTYWLALGLPPQPAIYLHLLVPLPRESNIAVQVTEPIDIHMVPLVGLSGRLIGPSGQGISGARICVTGRVDQTRTDARGAFTLDGIPARPDQIDLTVKSGRNQMQTQVTLSEDPVLITYQAQGD